MVALRLHIVIKLEHNRRQSNRQQLVQWSEIREHMVKCNNKINIIINIKLETTSLSSLCTTRIRNRENKDYNLPLIDKMKSFIQAETDFCPYCLSPF